MPLGSFRVNSLARYIPAASGSAYWIARISDNTYTTSNNIRGIAVDANDNVYLSGGASNAANGSDTYLVKLDSSGNAVWGKTLSSSSTGTETFYGKMAVASSGNIYVAGYGSGTSQTAGGNDFLIVKYDNNGNVQWQRRLGGTGGELGTAGCGIDSSENVYIAGYGASQTAGGNDFYIIKYNSSGTIQFQRSLGGTGSEQAWSIHILSSGAFAIAGQTTSATLNASAQDTYLGIFDSSGSPLAQVGNGLTSPSGATEAWYDVCADSGNNFYTAGRNSNNGGRAWLFKHNSSGTVLWSRAVDSSTNFTTANDQGVGCAVDSEDNVYLLTDNVNNTGILKYNSSGTLQWKRAISVSGGTNTTPLAITVRGSAIYCSILVGSFSYIFKLPTDGTGLGTFTVSGVTFTYADGTDLSASNSNVTSLQAYNRTFTATTRTLTAATTTLTTNTPTMDVTKVAVS